MAFWKQMVLESQKLRTMWHHMAHQFNAITLYKVSFTEQMAANVVDVFIHAVEHTSTQRTSITVSSLPKLRLHFFFFLDKEEIICSTEPWAICWVRAWSYHEKEIWLSVRVRMGDNIAAAGLEVYLIAFSSFIFHFYYHALHNQKYVTQLWYWHTRCEMHLHQLEDKI